MTRVNEEREAPARAKRAASREETVSDQPARKVYDDVRALAIWLELLRRRYWHGFLAGCIASIPISIIILLVMWRELDRTIVEWCGGR